MVTVLTVLTFFKTRGGGPPIPGFRGGAPGTKGRPKINY